MDEPLTYEELSRKIESASEGLAHVSHAVEIGASEYVTNLALLFGKAGIKEYVPSAWIVYAAMEYAELYFGDISRDEWLMIYDRGREIRQIAADHPEIADGIKNRRAAGKAEVKLTQMHLTLPDTTPHHIAGTQEPPARSAFDMAMQEELGLDLG